MLSLARLLVGSDGAQSRQRNIGANERGRSVGARLAGILTLVFDTAERVRQPLVGRPVFHQPKAPVAG